MRIVKNMKGETTNRIGVPGGGERACHMGDTQLLDGLDIMS